jgi:hypothetical protein
VFVGVALFLATAWPVFATETPTPTLTDAPTVTETPVASSTPTPQASATPTPDQQAQFDNMSDGLFVADVLLGVVAASSLALVLAAVALMFKAGT